MGEPSRVFIAHVSEDKPEIRELYDKLKERGYHPWLDEKDILPGQLWKIEIPKVIREAGIFLACFSCNSVDKLGYIQKELRLALDTYAEMSTGSIYFIPVRLDDCRVPNLQIPDLHLGIKDFQWLDLWEKHGYERLYETIDRALGESPDNRDTDEPWCPELVVIPPGSFMMGSPTDEGGRRDDEGPQHEVTIAYSLAVGRYPVTFAEWDAYSAVSGIDDHRPKGWWGRGRQPVVDVSWYQAQTYVKWLSEQTKEHYRLLSEAEWEYACRARTTTRYFYGDEITKHQATFGREHGPTTEIGTYPANDFGIHDMHGNVYEWVFDEWHRDYAAAPPDGRANIMDNTPNRRVLRGGSWSDMPRWLRSAARYCRSPSAATNKLGFRVCREV